MPLPVVRRGLRYHTAHYLPVAMLSCLIVLGFTQLLERQLINPSHELHYLYTLCAAVILCSGIPLPHLLDRHEKSHVRQSIKGSGCQGSA